MPEPSSLPPAVSWRDYIERILEERQRTLDLTAQALSARLELLTELRADVTRDREQFVTKAIFVQVQDDIGRRLARLEAMQARIIGVGSTLIVGAGLLGAFLGAVLTHVGTP